MRRRRRRRRWWQSPRSVGRRVGADTRATTQRQNRGHESNFERGPAWHKISTNTHAKKCSPRCWMPEIGNSYSYLVMHLCVSLPFPLPISISQSDFVSSAAPVCVVRPALSFSPRVPSHPRESKRRRTRDLLRGSAQRGSSWRKGAAGQITSRNNRPLMRVSPRGKTTRDGKVAVERERRNGKQGEEERERNEEALERTQSNTEEGDGGTDGQAQFERQVFCCGQHRTALQCRRRL